MFSQLTLPLVKGRCQLQVFQIDEAYHSVRSKGSHQDVTVWYTDGPLSIAGACFLQGTEDLCVLEHSGRLRIFSFITQTFRYVLSAPFRSRPIDFVIAGQQL